MKKLLFFVLVLSICVNFAVADKICPELKQKLSEVKSDTQIQILVSLEGELSFAKAAQQYRFLGDREVIKKQAIQNLKDESKKYQHWLLSSLTRNVSEVKGFWIVNTVAMKATPEAINELAQKNEVKYIRLDEPRKLLFTEKTWGLENLKTQEVWDMGYTGQGVVVSVIDTGCDVHNDLPAERFVTGYDFVNKDDDPNDDQGHGSHCAGTVAGFNTSGKHIGVAYDAKIMAVKVLNHEGSGQFEDVIAGIEYAAEKGADVASLSLGATGYYSPDMRRTCENSIAAGLVMVIAAGNSGGFPQSWYYPAPKNIGGPGNTPDVITIGAIDSNNKKASFSSFGHVNWDEVEENGEKPWAGEGDIVKPDVSAPGVDVYSIKFDTLDQYTTMSGTSMATPHTAGVVALILSAQPNLKDNHAGVKSILETTAIDIDPAGKDNQTGYGAVDSKSAVDKALESTLNRDGRFEMVVKTLTFSGITVNTSGIIDYRKDGVENDLMPAEVTIYVQVADGPGKVGVYDINFVLDGPNHLEGNVVIDFSKPADSKHGYKVGKFYLKKGTYSGQIKSNKPNMAAASTTLTVTGTATVSF